MAEPDLRFFYSRGRKVLSLLLRPPVLSDTEDYMIMTDDARSLATWWAQSEGQVPLLGALALYKPPGPEMPPHQQRAKGLSIGLR